MPQSRSNRNVFRSRLNCPISTSGWRNSAGKLFRGRASNRETSVAKARSCWRNDTSVDVCRSQSASTSVWDELIVFDQILCRLCYAAPDTRLDLLLYLHLILTVFNGTVHKFSGSRYSEFTVYRLLFELSSFSFPLIFYGIFSRWRPWRHFTQKSAATWKVHTQRPPGTYAAASASFSLQFLSRSTFVLV